MSDPGSTHRMIGINHVLRTMKDAGLVDEESSYAKDAVEDVQDELTKKAAVWYKVGARRGAIEVLDAIIDGRLTVKPKADGTNEIVAHVDEITWKKSLNITVGIRKDAVSSRTYKLKVYDLGFE